MKTNTKGFSSPVFAIKSAHRTYAYICAESAEQALHRAQQIRHELPMPRVGVEALWVKEGPLSGAAWYSDGFFKWQDQMADELAAGTIACPVCGR